MTSQTAATAMQHALSELQQRPGWHYFLDHVVDLACRRILEEAGVHEGCEIEIMAGRYAGQRFTARSISWSECEVGAAIGSRTRYFSLWHDTQTFRVVQAQQAAA